VAHYYLSWQTKRTSAPGLVELELPDNEAAWREAAAVAYDLWNHPDDRRDWGHLTIHVSNWKHQHVVSLSLDTLADTKNLLDMQFRNLRPVVATSNNKVSLQFVARSLAAARSCVRCSTISFDGMNFPSSRRG
jgi:hypothetical protein